eukprot:948394-Amphidinium_carterae.1
MLSNVVSSVRADTEAFWTSIEGHEQKPIDINRCLDQLKFSLAHRVYELGASGMISARWSIMMPKPLKSEARIQNSEGSTIEWSVDSPLIRRLIANADRIDQLAQTEEMVVSSYLSTVAELAEDCAAS